jgi:hypothetical protein
MTEMTIPTTMNRNRGRAGFAAVSFAVGAVLGITGTVLATGDGDAPARPALVQPRIAGQPGSAHDAASSCHQMSADAAERCLAAD